MQAEVGCHVSVVIPVHNAEAVLGEQLSALADQLDAPPFEVVVVDNGSTDGSVGRALGFLGVLPNLRTVPALDGVGPGHARNVGAQAAVGDALLFCDADDRVERSWVSAMLNGLGDWDIDGGPADTSVINTAGVRSMYRYMGQDAVDGLPRIFGKLRVAASNSMGVRASVFRSLGGFDETFSSGAEDLDFCIRGQMLGFSLGFSSEAKVHYRLRDTLSGMLSQQYGYGLAWAQLYNRHRDSIERKQGKRMELRIWVGLLKRVPSLIRPSERAPWLRDVIWNWARLWGSLRFGSWCPQ